MILARRIEPVLPAALALALAGAFWSLRLSEGESAVAALALAAALGAGAWALLDLEGFVLVPLLGAMIFPQALVHPGGALVAGADLLLVVALSAWLVRVALHRGPSLRLRGNPVLLPSLLFAAVNAASLAWSTAPSATVKAIVQTAEIVVVLPLVYASVPASLDRLRRALGIYVGLTCLLALTVAVLAAPRALHGVFEAQYLPGLHKTATGSFLAVGLVVAYAFSLDRGLPRRLRRWAGFAAALEAAGLLAALSRGALAGALAGMLVVSLLLRRGRLRSLALVTLGLAAFVLTVQSQLDARTAARSGYSTNTVRVLSYRNGLDKIAAHPVLGTGAGTYWDEIPELKIGLADPNNLFLLTWAELGIAGMAALLFLLWRYGRVVVRARHLPSHARVAALAAGGAALSLFVHFQVDSTWNRGTASICFALIGLALAATRLGREASAPATLEAAVAETLPAREPALRVLHVVSSDAFAGIERHVLRLARALSERDVDVTIACPPTARRLRDEAAASGIAVVPPPGVRRGGWLRDVDTYLRRRPDVVHAHDGAAAVAAWSLAGRGAARFVRTQHFVRTASSDRSGWRRTASLALHRALNADVDAVVAVSESAAEAARLRREVDAAKVTVIQPGIDLPEGHEVDAAVAERRDLRDPIVAYVGRLEREKSVDLLLCAVPLVLRHLPGCKFVIGGSGSAERELRELARKLRLRRNVTFLGEVEDAAAVLARAHVYANPSAAEGFGLAVAEAQAWALPVVGVASAGTAEIVADGQTGLLADTPDPEELAAAIVRLAADRELAEELGAEGRTRALARLGADRTADLTLRLYERLTR